MEASQDRTPEAQKSILYPFVEKQVEATREQLENEKKRNAMLNGTTEAPDFTLKDLNGKDVSLSQFRGKWVILDFWGSWCGWCIKGMPKLKEAYKEYAGRLEVIGIDCNETEEAWRAGVAKNELPWVNVYNPKESTLTSQYLVEGYPTKVIINPEGKIADITVGEDPAFYTKLASFLNK
ncbi:MAG: TlpA family protein disulfide reductase [Muribaculaceae bacterium]|nr:TlpA family protein disulfide reductase [Muribaculaceae bacterium]